MRFLNQAVDRKKVEHIFVDLRDEKDVESPFLGMYSNNDIEKVKRKRSLISSDFKTSFRVKKVFNIYFELNQSRWNTENTKSRKF
jgi:hypothetical protein